MHVLLDENLPLDLARQLTPHDVKTIIGLGWEGIKNGELLRRATGAFDVLVTMDRNLEFQQPISEQTFGVIVIRAASNRMIHLTPSSLVRFAELVPNVGGEANADMDWDGREAVSFLVTPEAACEEVQLADYWRLSYLDSRLH